MPEPFYYTTVPSAFGTLRIVWRETSEGAKVRRLLLPGEGIPAEEVMRTAYAGIRPLSNPTIEVLTEQIRSFLKGEAVDFEVRLVDLGQCSEFQREVLLAEHRIPRGWVSTYGRIARSLGVPNAARAVGLSMVLTPPFPGPSGPSGIRSGSRFPLGPGTPPGGSRRRSRSLGPGGS